MTFLNGIAREELDYRVGKEKISRRYFSNVNQENCNYDEYVNSVQGQLIKTVAYRKNNTFSGDDTFFKIVFGRCR